jgi:hypothetical protein
MCVYVVLRSDWFAIGNQNMKIEGLRSIRSLLLCLRQTCSLKFCSECSIQTRLSLLPEPHCVPALSQKAKVDHRPASLDPLHV